MPFDHHSSSSATAYSEDDFQWHKQGWIPLLSLKVTSDGLYLKLVGEVGTTKKRLTLYLKNKGYHFKNLPIFVRVSATVPGAFDVATFQLDSKTGKIVLLEITCHCNFDGFITEAWAAYPDICQQILWFLTAKNLPRSAFTLQIKDRFGLHTWISNPQQWYGHLRSLINKGPNELPDDERQHLVRNLKGLRASIV